VASEDELRRLISSAIDFWKYRWTDQGLALAVQMTTGNRFKIRDYFDFRFLVNETMIQEDLENSDPNMLSVKTKNLFRKADDGETQYGGDINAFYSPTVAPVTDDIGGYIVISADTGSPTLNGFYEIQFVDIVAQTWTTKPGEYFPRADTGLDFFVAFPYDEYLTEIRVVDEETGDGDVNRDLLEKLVELQRPSSERVNIVYVDFMDLFSRDNDLGLWTTAGYGAYTATVANGLLTLTGGASGETGIKADTAKSLNWTDYYWKTKLALKTNGSVWLGVFKDAFRLEINYSGFGTGYIRLWRNIASVWTALTAQIPHPSLNLDTYWTYSIEIYNLLATGNIHIKILIDGNVWIDTTSATTGQDGTLFLLCDNVVTMTVAETEMFQYPLDISRVGPNP
jgi:hypothetical protein